jgi:hypothetical protein
MIQNDTKKTSKNINFFICKICDFECCKKGDWNRHITRPKHLKHIEMIQNDTKKTSKNITSYICECGNIYKHHSGLWRHKKICNVEKELEKIDNIEKIEKKPDGILDKEVIMMLIKENSELKNMMMKVLENGTHNNNINNTNSHNKTFNLQFFLNETCKDAMNIMDFVESVKLQLSDLEKIGEIGYVDGISNIIVKNLNALDIEKRPVHCTDNKREILYIKDDNKWEKEDDGKKKIRKVIKKLADKNARLLPKFKEAHPDCNKASSKFSDQYNKLIVESMGGSGDNDLEKEDKIIRKIAKEVTIDKSLY